MLTGILTVITAPLLILNVIGTIIGVIWLLCIGQWKLVIVGLIVSFLFKFIYTLPALIQIPLGLLAYKCAEKKYNFLATIIVFINLLFINIVNLLWIFLVYGISIHLATGNSLPYLLFGYAVATAPLSFIASQDRDSATTSLGIFLTQLVFFILILSYYFNWFPFSLYLIILLLFSTVGLCTYAAYALIKTEGGGVS